MQQDDVTNIDKVSKIPGQKVDSSGGCCHDGYCPTAPGGTGHAGHACGRVRPCRADSTGISTGIGIAGTGTDASRSCPGSAGGGRIADAASDSFGPEDGGSNGSTRGWEVGRCAVQWPGAQVLAKTELQICVRCMVLRPKPLQTCGCKVPGPRLFKLL